MKKLLVCIAVTGTLLFAGTASVFASGSVHGRHTAHNSNYVRETSGVQGKSAVRSACTADDYDAVCDYHGASCRFVDEDGDGICDNACSDNSCTVHAYDGTGSGHHSGEHHSGGSHHGSGNGSGRR